MTSLRRPSGRGRGLVLKLFAVCALVAVIAVLATSWVTVQATVVAERQERQQTLHADAVIYDTLIDYAATHHSWSGAAELVATLENRFGQHITITDTRGKTLVGDNSKRALPPSQAKAVLDPIAVDPALAPTPQITQPTDQPATQSTPSVVADSFILATAGTTIDARITHGWTAARITAVQRSTRLAANRCMHADAVRRITALTPRVIAVVNADVTGEQAQTCLRAGFRDAVDDVIAPQALLHESGAPRPATVFWDFSGTSRLRIAGAAGAVLAVIVLLCAMLAIQIVRPLRRMAAVAHQAADGDLTARVPARRRDELGAVAQAFNHMADRRQQLEHARVQLMSDVSHELRAPLSNIRGWLEAAQDGITRTDRRLVESLLEETMQLQRLVEDVHQLATGDAGALHLEPRMIPVREFLLQVQSSFAAAATHAEVTISVHAAADTEIHADPFRLRQAIVNLVSNSLRHTSAGGMIDLRGDATTIAVQDTGTGIPREAIDLVFERFRRVDPARARTTGGSGLGLSIVKQYIELEGGRITMTSEPGAGTTVTLHFASL